MKNWENVLIIIVIILLLSCIVCFVHIGNKKYQIVFMDEVTNNIISEVYLKKGEIIPFPSEPHHENYLFNGWYKDDNQVLGQVRVNDNRTYYARFYDDKNNNGIADNEDYFVVTFIDSLNSSVIKHERVLYGEDAILPSIPLHDNYSFYEWEGDYHNIQDDTFVYAKYIKDAKRLTLDDIENILFNDKTVTYNGSNQKLFIDGVLNSNIKVEYQNNSNKDVGVYEVTAIFKGYGSYYGTVSKKAKLTIIKQDIIINIDSKTVKYGEESDLTWTYEGTMYDDLQVNLIKEESLDVGEYIITAKYLANDNYNVVVNDGLYKIEKRRIIVKTFSQSKMYDKLPLSDSRLEISGDGFYQDEFILFEPIGSIVHAGSILNDLEYTVGANTKMINYEIVKDLGTLSIYPSDEEIIVTIEGIDSEIVYDGKYHQAIYQFSSNNDDYKEDDMICHNQLSVKTVGNYQMNLQEVDFENINTDWANVKFITLDAHLHILPIDGMSINANSASWMYDGVIHADNNFNVILNGSVYYSQDGIVTLPTGDTIKATVKGEVLNVSDSLDGNNFISDVLIENNDNYTNVSINNGNLKITPNDGIVAKIIGNHMVINYDQQPHLVSGYMQEINKDIYCENDFVFSGNALASGTIVGTYYMGLNEDDFSNINDNFIDVSFIVVDGYLKIEDELDGMNINSFSNVREKAFALENNFNLVMIPKNALSVKENLNNYHAYVINYKVVPKKRFGLSQTSYRKICL